MKPIHSTRCLRPVPAGLLALVMGLLIGGCAPGVGGSGTGKVDDALAAAGAKPTEACGGDLAAFLPCANGTAAAPVLGASQPAPTAQQPVYLAGGSAGTQAQLTLEGNAALLAAPCAGVRFRGVWGVVSGQAGRWYGYNEQDASGAPLSLFVQTSASGLVLTLRDAADQTLSVSPLLTRVAALPTVGACN